MGVVASGVVSMIALPGLRVLHVGKYYPPKMGGIEIHLETLCGELRRHLDIEVVVANDAWRGTAGMVNGLKVARVGTLFNLANAPVCPGMVRRIREARADLVHIHCPNPSAILAYLASGHRGLLVISYHSDIVRQRVMSWAFRPFLRRALDRSAAIIASSANYVETSPVLSVYRDRCHVIPYGIDARHFQRPDPETVTRIRERFGNRIVISVGRLVYYKGFEYLIRAMAGVRGRLLIVGDGPLRVNLQREARAHGVADRVVFLGEINDHDIIPYYHSADVFALASVARSEAFGIVQLEAMACGKPVVNTRLDSGVPFVSLDGVTGLTVPPADPEALAKAINLLLDDPGRRAEYGVAARRRVQQEFSLEKMVHRTLQLYSEVMSSQFKPGRDSIHVARQAAKI
jgi:glycosyltransferase involved in cell wall biosynthesis